MRILHVTEFGQKNDALIHYNVGPKLTNGFIRNGHAVWSFSDRDVARASTPFGSRKFGVGACNRRLINVALNFKPDLLCLGHADVIRAETISKIRNHLPDLRVAQWNIDFLWIESNHRNICSKSEVVDVTFLSCLGGDGEKLSEVVGPVAYFPYPVDRSLDSERAFMVENPQFDLFYAIGGEDKKEPRSQFARRLMKDLGELQLSFPGFGIPPVFGAAFRERVSQCKMGLNFSRRNDVYLATSDRLMNYMGNGLMVFIDRATGFDEIFTQDELVFYDDYDDLIEKIRHYAENDDERKQIAEQGWKKVHKEFNEQLIAKYVIEATFGHDFSDNYVWPTTIHDRQT